MRKFLFAIPVIAILILVVISCKKTVTSDAEPVTTALSQEEKALVAAAGFDGGWAEKTADGKYLIEGDILLSKSALQSMAGVTPTHEYVIGNEEHYRTTNLVNTGSGVRDITVSIGSGFPAYYTTGLDMALAHYNSLNLNIHFTRVASGGEIHISGANLGRSFGGGCILGQSAGFPDANGNPAPGFTLSTNKCATQYISNAAKADEVMAHEIGHAIGFRHTDYMNRISCGSNSNEGTAGVGAIHIDGTVFTPTTRNYNSWMMACVNGDNSFSSEDNFALQSVY
jgi:hypothetical protein